MAATADEWEPVDGLERSAVLLRSLVVRGFRFIHPRDARGDVVAVCGVSAHHDVVDVIELRAEHDARAMRMPANEKDVWHPTTTLWRTSGPAHTVLARLVDLLDREAANSNDGAQGCGVPVRPGNAVLLPGDH